MIRDEQDEAMNDSANDAVYCWLCMNSGRVRGLDENDEPCIDPCVLCHPERLGFEPNRATEGEHD